MRRLVYWLLPVLAAAVAVALFGSGLFAFVTGRRGDPVDVVAKQPQNLAPRSEITPIILGDSLARGAGDEAGLGIGGRLDDELRRRKVKARRTANLAVNGARTADLLQQLESSNVRGLLAQANVVIISIGGNDLWGGNDWRSAPPADPDAVMANVLDRIDRAVTIARQANPKSRIFIIGLYNPFSATPMGRALSALVAKWNSKLIERFASDPNITIVQTADLFVAHDRLAIDRFHPGGEAYGLIARRIADAL